MAAVQLLLRRRQPHRRHLGRPSAPTTPSGASYNTTDASKGYRVGFAYGSQVAGSSSATSYLYSATNGAGGAIPYTEVYLRPKVLSTDAGFTTVSDAGTTATTRPKARARRHSPPRGA